MIDSKGSAHHKPGPIGIIHFSLPGLLRSRLARRGTDNHAPIPIPNYTRADNNQMKEKKAAFA